MKKNILLVAMLGLATVSYAQTGRVGINTKTPKTTLDVSGKTDASGNLLTTDVTGLQAPRLTRAELTAKGDTLYGADQKGALVYITDVSAGDTNTQRVNITSTGYYYFDGSVWVKVGSGSGTATPEPWYNVATNAGATANTQDIYQMGNVGIGTATPTAKLDVKGMLRVGDSQVSGENVSRISLNYTGAERNYSIYNGNTSGTSFSDFPSAFSIYEYGTGTDGSNLTNPRIFFTKNSTKTSGDGHTIIPTGNVGIGSFNAPTTRLEIQNGTTAGAIKIVDGTQGVGKVLTSDANGVGTWQDFEQNTIAGVIPASETTEGLTTSKKYTWTGCYIDLPAGEWQVHFTAWVIAAGSNKVIGASNAGFYSVFLSTDRVNHVSPTVAGNIKSVILPKTHGPANGDDASGSGSLGIKLTTATRLYLMVFSEANHSSYPATANISLAGTTSKNGTVGSYGPYTQLYAVKTKF